MNTRDTTFTRQTPAEVFAMLGQSSLSAMATAEKYGSAQCGNAVVIHDGYVRDARSFDASTALYRVTF